MCSFERSDLLVKILRKLVKRDKVRYETTLKKNRGNLRRSTTLQEPLT
ncbi:MAG TPA: hypothetical protein VJH22_00605 [Candidatus Nanoarchaeia archaeon]|nr:hypothetical protein [Candidatus Nanoarchaeia archaeon]